MCLPFWCYLVHCELMFSKLPQNARYRNQHINVCSKHDPNLICDAFYTFKPFQNITKTFSLVKIKIVFHQIRHSGDKRGKTYAQRLYTDYLDIQYVLISTCTLIRMNIFRPSKLIFTYDIQPINQ